MSTAASSPPRIADYELLKLIGSGSYGDVWLARSVTGQFRAVKIVARDRFSDPEPYEREFRGLKEFAAISLSESRQMALLHVGRDDAAGFFYYVMELADDVTTGRDIVPERYVPNTLREVRDRRGRLPANEVVVLGIELARAVSGLHARGLIHRDIKPSNVILVGGSPKLADVGLVAVATEARTFVGTEGYVPPEGPGTPAADVYAIGRVLYEIATGRNHREFPALPENFGQLVDRRDFLELNEVIIRACDPDAHRRHPDAATVLEDLLLLQAGKSVRRLRSTERHLQRALRATVALALVAAVAGTGAWIAQRRANREMALRAAAEAERDALNRRAVYTARVAQAQQALLQQDNRQARRLLEEAQRPDGAPDLRNFEWRVFSHEAKGDPHVVLQEEGAAGTRIRFSPDNRWLAVHCADETVSLWDMNRQERVREVRGVQRFGGFSADSRWLMGSDQNFAPVRWSVAGEAMDVEKSIVRIVPIGPAGPVDLVYFSAGAENNEPRLGICTFGRIPADRSWKIKPASGSPRESFQQAALSPDNSYCALALVKGRAQAASWRILVFDLASGDLVWEQQTNHRPTAIALSPDNRLLVCAWADIGEIHAIDLRARQTVWHATMSTTPVLALLFRSAQELLAVGRSSALTVLDAASGATRRVAYSGSSDFTDVATNAAGTLIGTTGSAGDIRLWNPELPTSLRQIGGFWVPAGGGRELRLSADGRWLAATAAKDRIRVVSLNQTAPDAFIDGIAPIDFVADRPELWTFREDGALQRWQFFPTPALLQQIPGQVQSAPCIAASSTPDRRWIGAIHADGALVITDTTGKLSTRVISSLHRYPWWVSLSPDGRYAATSGQDQFVRLWSIESGKMEKEWSSRYAVNNGTFSPQGDQMAFALGNGMLEVRAVSDPTKLLQRRTSSGNSQAIAFSPDGSRLALGGQKGSVHLFATDTWTELARLESGANWENVGATSRAMFSLDGSALAAYAEFGRVRIWRTQVAP